MTTKSEFFSLDRTLRDRLLFVLLIALLNWSCKKADDPIIVKSDKTEVTNLMLTDFPGLTPVLDVASATYAFSVAAGTDVKKLSLTFGLATGATATPQPGSVQDFTNPVPYTVTAENKTTTKTFRVRVIVQASPKSTEKQLLSFSFGTLSPPVQTTVNQTTKAITATLSADANLAALVPTITVSAKATVSPASGVSQDFSRPVNYTVTAEDGSTQVYQATIDKRIVSSVPAALGLNSFYKKYLDASGIPVVSSAKVPDEALIQARNSINQMLDKRPDVVVKMKQNKIRVAIMAETEVTTDIPEHSDLYTAFPGTDWNTRARGLGATLQRPACSCAEENLLCKPSDRYLGEDILMHEFAHGIHQMGINFVDPGFDKELEGVYKEAIAKGLWANTYAASNYIEYWAEGVQDWFDVNKESIPSNGIHNSINTREELKAYDPKLYELISRYFNVPARKVSCQIGK